MDRAHGEIWHNLARGIGQLLNLLVTTPGRGESVDCYSLERSVSDLSKPIIMERSMQANCFLA